MKPNNEHLLSKLIFLTELILFAIAAFVIYTMFGQNMSILIFMVNAGIAVSIYKLLKDRKNEKIRKYLIEMSTVIDSLSDDMNINIRLTSQNPVLEDFYLSLEKLRNSILVKEANRQEVLAMVDSIAANIELEKLLEDLMPKLLEITNSNCGAFYLANNVSNKLEIKHSIGFSKNLFSEFDITLGEGFIGNIVSTKQTKVLTEIPDDTIYVLRTFLGKIKPKSIMVVPILNQDILVGVLALASIYEYTGSHLEIVDMMKYYIGVAVGNGITYEKTKRLTNELKFQNKLIQELNSDLEKKVQERTLFLNDIIDSIKDYAIYAINVNGVIETWNKGAENILGYSSEEIIGQHLEYMYDSKAIKTGKVQVMIESVMREGLFMESRWNTRKDGSLYYAETTIFARYGNNREIIGFTNVTRDITTSKKIESALWFEKELNAKIMEGSESALLLVNEKGVISMANDNAKERLDEEMPIGTYLYQYFKDEIIFNDKIEKVLKNTVDEEFSAVLKKDGKELKISASSIGDDMNFTKMVFIIIA